MHAWRSFVRSVFAPPHDAVRGTSRQSHLLRSPNALARVSCPQGASCLQGADLVKC